MPRKHAAMLHSMPRAFVARMLSEGTRFLGKGPLPEGGPA